MAGHFQFLAVDDDNLAVVFRIHKHMAGAVGLTGFQLGSAEHRNFRRVEIRGIDHHGVAAAAEHEYLLAGRIVKNCIRVIAMATCGGADLLTDFKRR